MSTVKDLLGSKGDDVWAVAPTDTVKHALAELAAKDIGALLVMEEDVLVGIVSERDFVRAVANYGACKLDAPVDAYMTREVITVKPETYIIECMELMSTHHFRHLPVVKGGKVVGVISIGDVVREIIDDKESMIRSLENYIEGTGYPR
jgi:CBS domain-containing protein